jgi:hypothetical protein
MAPSDCTGTRSARHRNPRSGIVRRVALIAPRVADLGARERGRRQLTGMLCIEANDEWLVRRRYLSAESISMCLAGPRSHNKEIKEEMAQLQAA